MTGGVGLRFVTTPQSQLRFDSSPCTGAPLNRKILRKENRPERARRAYITCAERNHHAAGASRARSAHITFINVPEGHTSLARSAIITPQAHHAPIGRSSLLSTCPKGIHHLRGAQSSRCRRITRAERAHHFFVAGVPCSFVRNGNELRSNSRRRKKKRDAHMSVSLGFRQLPIFPGRHQPSIVGVCALNFCVRDGNRWDRTA